MMQQSIPGIYLDRTQLYSHVTLDDIFMCGNCPGKLSHNYIIQLQHGMP